MSKRTVWSNFLANLKENEPGEPPPVLKSWRTLYLIVLGNLICWIIFFIFFTRIFK